MCGGLYSNRALNCILCFKRTSTERLSIRCVLRLVLIDEDGFLSLSALVVATSVLLQLFRIKWERERVLYLDYISSPISEKLFGIILPVIA